MLFRSPAPARPGSSCTFPSPYPTLAMDFNASTASALSPGSSLVLAPFSLSTILFAVIFSVVLYRLNDKPKGSFLQDPKGSDRRQPMAVAQEGTLGQDGGIDSRIRCVPRPSFRAIQLTSYATGPIYTLRLGFQTVIVVGRASVALELLDKRSAIYSSRPRTIMTSELVREA